MSSDGTPKHDPKKMTCPGPTPDSDQWHTTAACDRVTAEKIGGSWKLTRDAAGFVPNGYRCVAHAHDKETWERQKARIANPAPRPIPPARRLPTPAQQAQARADRHRAEAKAAEQDAINRRVSAAIAAEMRGEK